MKTTFISTSSVSNATRLSILKMQAELAKSQKEVSSGRQADVGLALGARTGQTVSLRQEHAHLQSIIDSNGVVSSRLDTTQQLLGGFLETAQSFIGTLIDARSGATGANGIEVTAKANLTALIGGLNTTQNGEYLFAGLNTDVKPIEDYYANPPAANKQAVDAAFTAYFGFAQSDPAADGITAADMQNFLDTDFAALFDGAAWSSTWSSASDQTIRSRISPAELIETGSTANQPAMQKLAMAYTMVADLGTESLNENAYQALIDTATKTVGEAVKDLTEAQAQLGLAQDRVGKANDRMSVQKDVVSTHINALEGVDPYEASTRVNDLLTQIETAYALTSRIQQLSLLDYL
jgi:flagellar hook-associated protein 3 FlgL